VTYYQFEVGHILHVQPDEVGELTPAELLGATVMFEGLYQRG
jgi:hypothetical protein